MHPYPLESGHLGDPRPGRAAPAHRRLCQGAAARDARAHPPRLRLSLDFKSGGSGHRGGPSRPFSPPAALARGQRAGPRPADGPPAQAPRWRAVQLPPPPRPRRPPPLAHWPPCPAYILPCRPPTIRYSSTSFCFAAFFDAMRSALALRSHLRPSQPPPPSPPSVLAAPGPSAMRAPEAATVLKRTMC